MDLNLLFNKIDVPEMCVKTMGNVTTHNAIYFQQQIYLPDFLLHVSNDSYIIL